MQKKIKDAIQELSLKYNLPIKVVHEMVKAPWNCQSDALSKVKPHEVEYEELPVFYHTNLGSFVFSKDKLDKQHEQKSEDG